MNLLTRLSPGSKRSVFGGLLGHASLLTVPRFLALVLAVPAGVIIARRYGPAGKGELAAFAASTILVTQFLDPGIGDAVAFQSSRGRGLRRPRRTLLIFWTGIGSTSVLGLVVFASHEAKLVAATIAVVAGILATEAAIAVLGLRGPAAWAWSVTIQPLGFLVSVSILVLKADQQILHLIWAYAFSFIPGAAVMVCLLPKTSDSAGSSLRNAKDVMTYGLIRHMANVGQLLLLRLDVVILAAIAGNAATGRYSVGYGLGEMITWVPASMGAIVFSAELRNAGGTHSVLKLSKAAVGIALVAALGLVLLGHPLITRLYGQQFGPSYLPLVILLPGLVGLSLARALSSLYVARGLVRRMAAMIGIVVVPAAICTLFAVQHFGMLGAATVSSVAYASLAFVVIADARRSLAPLAAIGPRVS